MINREMKNVERLQGSTTCVITYFRKGADLLRACLKSVTQASEKGDAIIVVDDASCDGVAEFVKSSFPEVHFVSLHSNLGPGEARNEALRRVQTEFVQFVDADDLIHPQRTHLLAGFLRSNPNVPFVSAHYTSFIGAVEFEEIEVCDFEMTPSYAVSYLPCAGLFRMSFIRSVGLFDSSRRWMDLSFHARIIAKEPFHMHLSIPMYAYRQDVEGQISSATIDKNAHALHSFVSARRAVDARTARLWLYPLATTLARQSRDLPIGLNKLRAFSQPVILAPTCWKSFKWILFSTLHFFSLRR